MMYWIRTVGDIKNIVSENGVIPEDEANMDYQAYLAWVAEGNTADRILSPEEQLGQ